MKFDKKFCLLILVLFFVSVSFVSATGDDDQTIELIDNEELSVDSATFSDLNEKIQTAGDTVDLEKDYTYDSSFSKDGIVINKTITINGNGKTIDGQKNARIFNITADSVTINNLNFINAYVKVNEDAADNGAAIYCTGSKLILNNCTFTNNYGGCHGGGAVYVEGANCEITGCEFTKNTGSNSGGAVKITGSDAIIKDNNFTENTAVIRHGGALYIVADNVQILNNVFTGNVAKYSGGAFRIVGDENTISDNKFTSNKAKETLGGAVSILGDKNKVTNNYFEKNYAGRDGGALDIEGDIVDTNGMSNVVKLNVFTENEAGEYGGALSINTQDGTVDNNTFTANIAGKLGGAIRVTGASSNSCKITKNIIEDNIAGVSGGAIYAKGSGLSINNNKITGNSAVSTAGGAINIHGDNNIIKDNAIASCRANMSGGAIYAEGNNFYLTDNTIELCSAGTTGGALYLKGDEKATISNNKFNNNYAESLAGAIQIKTNDATISNNEFNQNIAVGSGGAIYSEGKTYTVTNNKFNANKVTGASSVGGAIRHKGDDATITGNRFEGNKASSGWSIFGEGDGKTIEPNTYVTTDQSKEVVWEQTATAINVANQTVRITLKSKSVSATLLDEKGNPIAGKLITFTIRGVNYEGTTNAKGVATAKINLNVAKTYLVVASFKGDSQYKATTQKGALKIIKVNTKITAPTYKFKRSATKKVTVTLTTPTGLKLAKKTVYLKVNGVKYKGITNAKGQVTIKVKLTKKSTYIYAVAFGGDAYYNKVLNKGTIVVK